jgi:AmiR/NasT family two-component response regulator
MSETIDELHKRAAADRKLIANMAAEGVADRELIAALASEGIAGRKQLEEVKAALIVSRRIGAATGVLMGTRHISEDKAFEQLRDECDRSNRSLSEVADEVCESAGVITFE